METESPFLPVLTLIIPSFVSLLILFTGKRRPNLREFWTLAGSFAMFFSVWSMLDSVLKGRSLEYHLAFIYPDLSFSLKVDVFGMIFALLSSFLWMVVSVYSIGYMRGLNEQNQTRFFFCFAIAILGAAGVALSGNLITLYMFYEILTLSTYPLVSHKENREAIKAGRKYLVYLIGSSVFILLAMGITYHLAGTLDFVPGGLFDRGDNNGVLRFLFLLFVIGFGVKAGIMPIHEWLPSAMVAPTPVSALLHAVAVVKAGVFCVLRVILYVFGPEMVVNLGIWFFFAFFVSLTVIFANIIAINQDNLKRRLAFSTINNLAIIILGATLLTPDAMKGAYLHMFFHGFMKITLFMCAGAIYVKTHKELISEMEGIGRQMPITMAAFTVGALGLFGIPPVCGFISKWYLCMGAAKTEGIIFLLVFLLSALLDGVYFIPIIYSAFFKEVKGGRSIKGEADLSIVLPIVTTGVFSLLLTFFPDFFFRVYTLSDMAVKIVRGG